MDAGIKEVGTESEHEILVRLVQIKNGPTKLGRKHGMDCWPPGTPFWVVRVCQYRLLPHPAGNIPSAIWSIGVFSPSWCGLVDVVPAPPLATSSSKILDCFLLARVGERSSQPWQVSLDWWGAWYLHPGCSLSYLPFCLECRNRAVSEAVLVTALLFVSIFCQI